MNLCLAFKCNFDPNTWYLAIFFKKNLKIGLKIVCCDLALVVELVLIRFTLTMAKKTPRKWYLVIFGAILCFPIRAFASQSKAALYVTK